MPFQSHPSYHPMSDNERTTHIVLAAVPIIIYDDRKS